MKYTTPVVVDLGSFAELTLDDIYKDSGSGDVLHIAGQTPVSIPGGTVLGVS